MKDFNFTQKSVQKLKRQNLLTFGELQAIPVSIKGLSIVWFLSLAVLLTLPPKVRRTASDRNQTIDNPFILTGIACNSPKVSKFCLFSFCTDFWVKLKSFMMPFAS